MATIAAPRRTILLLALCQALALTGQSIVATTGSIVGSMLAADKALATLPIATQMTGMMAASIPASLLMARIGRRNGFWVGTAIGMFGAVLAVSAIWRGSFVLLCVGTAILGCYNGFSQKYRFAAAECADEGFRAQAISLVMAGGVISGLFGPEIAKWTRDLFEPALFAGCFAFVGVLCAAVALLLSLVRLPAPPPVARHGGGRPLRVIAAQPLFLVATACGMVGYGVMALVMTATPIALIGCGHDFADAAFVIQWHILAMYAPSFVTGHLIGRFGITAVLLTGAALLLACCGINLAGTTTLNFWSALVMLGLGWNFLFVGATTLVTRTYAASERAKVQALTDFLIFGTVTVSAFASGVLLDGLGWRFVQIAAVPALAAVAAAVLWVWRQPRRAEPRYAGL